MKQEKTWLKQLDTILSESDSEEEQKRGEEETTGGEEEEEKVTTEETPKTDQQQRRGERQRNKPDFFGHNIMVTQLSPASSPEQNPKK